MTIQFVENCVCRKCQIATIEIRKFTESTFSRSHNSSLVIVLHHHLMSTNSIEFNRKIQFRSFRLFCTSIKWFNWSADALDGSNKFGYIEFFRFFRHFFGTCLAHLSHLYWSKMYTALFFHFSYVFHRSTFFPFFLKKNFNFFFSFSFVHIFHLLSSPNMDPATFFSYALTMVKISHIQFECSVKFRNYAFSMLKWYIFS